MRRKPEYVLYADQISPSGSVEVQRREGFGGGRGWWADDPRPAKAPAPAATEVAPARRTTGRERYACTTIMFGARPCAQLTGGFASGAGM